MKKNHAKKGVSKRFNYILAGLVLMFALVIWIFGQTYLSKYLGSAPPMENIPKDNISIGHIIAPMVSEEKSETYSITFEDEFPEPVLEKQPTSTAVKEDRHILSLIIDDVGYDMKALRRLLELPYTITVSILPDAPYAKQAAQMAYQHGITVMLHMPMQTTNPKYQSKMEDFYLHTAMNKEIFTQVFEDALAKVPHATGINNHMGSALTADKQSMQWLMELCEKNNLFFIDSRTSAASVAAEYAEQAGIAWNQRDIFLDHTITDEGLQHAWDSALSCIQKNDHCIMLAHPHKETLNFLEQHTQDLNSQSFVSISNILK